MVGPSSERTRSDRPASAAIWTALGAVYVVWGTTYLAIAEVNDSLPPLLAAAARFLIAGGVLYAWSVRRGDRAGDQPGPRQWRSAAVVGTLLLAGGNGGVVWAERTVPSGIVALLIAVVPLWMALFDRIAGRRALGTRTAVGLVMGFGGVVLLIGSSAAGHVQVGGMLLVVVASLCWTAGSLYSRNAALPRRPLLGAGMEMLVGGGVLAALGAAAGELRDVHPERFSAHSVIALAYLILFGSLVGYTAYVWLLRSARTSLVSTYAYVNPVVAVVLGWLVRGEPIGVRTVVAGAVIVTAVALIVSAGRAAREEMALEPGEQPRAIREPELALEGVGDAEEHRLAEHGRGDLQPDG